jgi:predicted dehydrogenase
MEQQTSRREFVRAAGAITAASYGRIMGANDKVGVGYIGLGNRGDQVHDAFLEHGDARTVAVCDLRDDYLDFAIGKSRATPARFNDYRKLLEHKEVDAVAIATPDHWHALMFIDACNAGKDVYVEKPLCLTVVEGRKMVDAANRTKRVSQVGIHRRSTPSLKEAAELARSGGIGTITSARGFHRHNEWPNGIGMGGNVTPPSERAWDQWLGPAPRVPYDRNRSFYNFRWFYNYSGGQLTNYGVHYMDMLRWCMGREWPRAVVAMGGRYAGIKDNREIPDTLEVLWDFGDAMMVFSQSDANGAASNPKNAEMEVRGTKGTLYLDSGRWEVAPERITETLYGFRSPVNRAYEKSYSGTRKPAMQAVPSKGSAADTAFHTRNFLDCIKSRAKCNCDVLTGHISTSATIIGNIAHKLKAYLEWDAKTERFTNHREANQYLHYEYRAPYKLG